MRRACIAAAVGHLALVVALLAAFRLVGERWGWVALAFYSPRALFALPVLITAPALFATGARKWLWLPVATALLVAGPLMGLHFGSPGVAQGPTVRVLTCNVWFGAGDLRVLEQEITEAKADVILFQAAAHSADVIIRNLPEFHYIHDDQFAVASRWPVRVTGRGTWVSERLHRPWVKFAIDSPLGELEVLSVHPHSPRELFARRALRALAVSGPAGDPHGTLSFLRQQLGEIAAAARTSGPLLVAAGDFNVPDGGSLLPQLFGHLDDAFAQAGRGYGYTFPVHGRRVPWLRLDRVLLGQGLRAVSAKVDARRGSDHAAVIVDLTRSTKAPAD